MQICTGIDILSITKMASNTDNIEGESREKAVKTISRHIEDSIDLQRDFAKRDSKSRINALLNCGKARGTYVTCVYIISKILYIFNVVAQFLVMNEFLGQHNHLWGFNILTDLYYGREWQHTGNFPRVNLCDFQVCIDRYLHLNLHIFRFEIYIFVGSKFGKYSSLHNSMCTCY
jgi:hypothetical protein